MHSKGNNIREIPRSSLKDLAKAVACNTLMPANVFFQVLQDASVKTVLAEPKVINIIKGEDWRAPIMTYICYYYEPDNKNEQTRMQQ
jgi:hypothetical protein